MRLRQAATVVGCLTAIALSSARVSAQHTYEPLHSFVEPAFPPMGRLVEASSGRFYGVARNAGAFNRGGVIAYDRQPDGTLASTVVHSFNGADGASPQAALVQGSDGAMYGCAFGGGASDNGTIYRIAPDGTFSLLHSLGTAPLTGPCAELTAAGDGHLYGMSGSTVFRMTTGGVLSVVATVAGGWPADANGVVQGGLIDGGDGKLYGINSAGQGQIFSVTFDGTVEVLHSFSFAMGPFGATGELNPRSFIDGRDGFFYGTTSVFEMPPLGTAVSKVYRISRTGAFSIIFTGSSAFPQQLETLVRGTDGNFYGTTRTGGVNDRGQLFRLTPGGAISTIHSFQISTGILPNSLIQTADGMLFGSTEQGALNRRGAIFRSTTTGQYAAVNTLAGTEPLLPLGSLLEGPDGTLYGTSCLGGLYNAGTVFKIAGAASTLTVLHSFAYWDGACPRGALTFGHDGALYGATSHYGLGGYGTLFRMTTAGALSPIFFFNGANGATPLGGLLFASDGLYYGTTNSGGDPAGGPGLGTVFRWSRTGAFTTLHRFPGSELFASRPVVPLMQASTGDIYGATYLQPFRMTLGGTVTAFNSPGGGGVRGAFEEGPDGNLYNTVGSTGFGPGSIFRITPSGGPIHLHDFTGPDGSIPYAGLRLAPDGWFYGSTSAGGANDLGVLFRFSGSGTPVTLHEFSGPDGAFPANTLMLGADGALYGTTLNGGQGDRGVIFKLTRPQ